MSSTSTSRRAPLPSSFPTMLAVCSNVSELRAHGPLMVPTDNPYSAAQRFLQENELPLSYLDEVVRFIEKNTAGVNIGNSASSQFVDPYTGEWSRLILTFSHTHCLC